jgi:N-acylneuraminate cytidylyltransferase
MISFFIPIRKNSKRIKNKNSIRVNKYKYGLTEIKIKQFKKLKKILEKKKIIAEFVVSTDCSVIKNYLKKFKWIKVNNRPKSLSGDDCIDKLISFVPKICKYKYILWTHVTSPLFDENNYITFIKTFFNHLNKYTSAFSADKISTFVINSKGLWISHNFRRKKWPRSQDIKPLYAVNNAAFINSRLNYLKFNDRISSKPLPIITPKRSSLDIDYPEDMRYLKQVI